MFGFDSTTKSEETATGKFIPAGINENVKLKEITYNNGETFGGTEVIEFVFEDSLGRTVNRRYFDPSKTQYDVEKAMAKFNRICKNVATKFLGENFEMAGAPNFKAFVDAYIAALQPHFGTGDLRLKVILNKSDYPTLPNYAPFCELMSVPADQSKLKINPTYDRTEPFATNDDTTTTSNETASSGAAW
jgi:hypothetical protein